MRIKGKFARVSYNDKRQMEITFTIIGKPPELIDIKDKDLDITLEKSKVKRSRNANNYMWELVGQLAVVTNHSTTEIYRRAIRAVGIYRDWQNLTKAEAQTLSVAWSKLGLGWFSDPLDYEQDGDHIVLRTYYGSSTYNTAQMRRLIEWIVQDCRAVGINTLTPEEQSLLIDNWKGNTKIC